MSPRHANLTHTTGWGRALDACSMIERPETPFALAAVAPAIGNRRSYGDAALNDQGKAIDMTRLDRIIAFDQASGLLCVEAGITIGDIARLFAPRGWLPAVIPGTGFATVGGCIAMDVHGKNHHLMGSFCQHVTEITLIQQGKRRKISPNNARLWAATCGGIGQTGIIAQACLQMIRSEGALMRVTEQRARNWDGHLALLNGCDAAYTVGWIDATAIGAALGRGIVEQGEPCHGQPPKHRLPWKIPLDAPYWLLSRPVVKAFNAAYYHRVPEAGRTELRSVPDFFFPLDKIRDWNRLYGKRGFHQFQCVVPPDQTDALRDMLALIARSGIASPLAILKRMGDGRAGYLSFAMQGYTLAVDFPNCPQARRLIAQLEDATAAAGGRLYLAKDSLASGPRIKAMYPDHAKWAKEASKADPRGLLQTDMTRRLTLRTI